MIICPNCKSEVDDDSCSCSNCGVQFGYCLKCRKLTTGRRCGICGSVLVKMSDRASMIAIRPSQRISFVPQADDDDDGKMRFDAMCDAGLRRHNNEDMVLLGNHLLRNGAECQSITAHDSSRYCAVVADGMGGNEGGEYASELSLKLFREFVDNLPSGLTLDELRTHVNRWTIDTHIIVEKGGGDERYASMGTTLSGCFIYDDKMYWINIGDSRIYILRDGIFRQITNDHTLRNLMHDDSIPSNVIYNCLGGGGNEVFADFDELPLYENDRLLICSDGLSDMLNDEVLMQLLEAGAPAKAFVEKANEAGGYDNISLITLSVKSEK